MTEYKYDVAISFLANDEALATSIHDELGGRLSVFLYSKRQEDLAGTEGDQSFAEVFKTAARVVVVLYRPTWGETRWTRVEMNAIRSRALEYGWRFCLFVPLENRMIPDYVPAINIWYDFAGYGTKSLVAVIARMAQEHGAHVGKDDAIERAARLARLEQFRLKREKFRGSVEGVESMQDSFEAMCDRTKVLAGEISEKTNGAVMFTVKGPTGSKQSTERSMVVLAMNVGLLIYKYSIYGNTLSESYVTLDAFKGHPPFPGVMTWGNHEPFASRRYEFDLAPIGPVWKLNGEGEQELDAQSLADTALKFLIEHQEHVTREGGGR